MNYIITEEELTSLEKTGNPSYRKSVEYVIGRIRSRPVEPRQVMPDYESIESDSVCSYCARWDGESRQDCVSTCTLNNRFKGKMLFKPRLTAQPEGGESK